ncbi:MAG: SoxR reducing system RseC family protein [Sideroxydans sp.]|nr:SoxR reducing system RseC family protein [Sideroxydans sp.]
MLETRATVVAISEQRASVLVNQVSGCEQCNGQGCGSSQVAKLFCSQAVTFEVLNQLNAKVGDEVVVAVQDGAVLRGISVLYLLPIVMLVWAASIASYWLDDEFWVALGAVLGLLLGFAMVKVVARQLQPKQPYIQNVIECG